jgi:antitoxin MazE
MIRSTITKWGNSLALRIPHSIAAQLGVQENSNVTLELEGDRLVITRGQNMAKLLDQITDENRHSISEMDAPYGREMI